MSDNKTKPTEVSVDQFLETVSEQRQQEAKTLIDMMQQISKEPPAMWGPSIIGFGSMHYKYDTGREGDVPILGFSPRKAAITVYFEGFDDYGDLLAKLGKHKISKACLYVNKLEDVDLDVLRQMLERSYRANTTASSKPSSVDEYIAQVPSAARPQFDKLRSIVTSTIPEAKGVLSYDIIGYKVDDKRARVYISGWKDHVAVYPIPKDKSLQKELQPYTKGKGTLWFGLNEPLPEVLIKQTVLALVKS